MSDFLKEPLDEKYDNGFLDGFQEALQIVQGFRMKMDSTKENIEHALVVEMQKKLHEFNDRYSK